MNKSIQSLLLFLVILGSINSTIAQTISFEPPKVLDSDDSFFRPKGSAAFFGQRTLKKINDQNEKANCIPGELREIINKELQKNIDSLTKEGIIVNNSKSMVLFRFPLEASTVLNWNNYYGISNYVDQQAGSGILDYNCGNRTYDGHNGIDYFTWPFPFYLMEFDLVHVVAGAPGVIVYKLDGSSSYNCAPDGSSGNGLIVQHNDGSVAWYWHFKEGTINSKNVGQSVVEGEYLGIVGSSGSSTAPHLHFQVQTGSYNGPVIEPHMGNCNNLNSNSWWQSQEAYRVPKVNVLFTHSAPPEMGCPNTEEEPNFENDFQFGDQIIFAAYFRDQMPGMQATYKVIDPNGVIWAEWTQASSSTYDASYWYWTYNSLPFNGPFGQWIWQAEFNNEIVNHFFNYYVVCNVQVNLNNTNTTCGQNNGSITATPSGGSGYAYAWSNGSSAQIINNLSPGSYTVTVTSSNGCTATASSTINSSSGITVSNTVTQTTCGQNNGSITATPSGGSGYTYAWSNGASTQTISNLSPGSYTVTVTSSNGCTATASSTINSSSGITVSNSVTQTTCGQNNGSITATPAGGSGYTYAWSNGASTQTINNLSPGSYTVTVTSSNGCTTTASSTINSSSGITVSNSVTQTTCGLNNGSITATPSGGSGYTYVWSNGASTQTINNLSPGSYTVTVTSSNGCTVTASSTINSSSGITVSNSVTQTTCGQNNGSITATPSGGSGYTYAWSNDASTQTINNLSPGSYTVTVTSSNGCTATVSSTINSSSGITVSNSVTQTTCGQNNGSITATPAGGSGYTYAWSNGASTQTINNLSPGSYTVTVTSSNGCTTTASSTINSSSGITVSNSVTQTICGLNNGSITATPSGGSGYTYTWSNGASTQTISNLSPGSYTVTVTSSNGCTATASSTINSSNPVTVNVTPTHTTCSLNNGSATAMASGGSNHTYLWSTGNTGSSISNLAPGTYAVTVTAGNGCTATASTVINSSSGISVSTSVTHESCNNCNDGTATANPAGGTSYSYQWSNGANTQTINNLSPGTYVVTVTSNAGCTATSSTVINAFGCPSLNINTTSSHPTCQGDCEGSISISPSGGQSPYTYLWNTGATTSDLNDLCGGSYSVTVTDANLCPEVANITLSEGALISLSLDVEDSSCGLNNGIITANTSGSAGITYLWNTGANTQTISGLSPGFYSVTVTGVQGCSNESSAEISQSQALTLLTDVTHETCNNCNDGSITVIAQGGQNYTYLWSTGATGSVLQNLSPGMYSVTVTSSDGCTATAVAEVNAFGCAPFQVSFDSNPPVCSGDCNGMATVIASGGSGTYTYSWNNGNTQATLSNICAGSYSVTVTDSDGCTGTGTLTLNEGISLQLSTNASATSCGLSNGSMSVSASGGSSYTYLWQPGDYTTSTVQNVPAGTYTVIVTDASGCTASATVGVAGSSLVSLETTSVATSCGLTNGSVSVSASGGSNLTYLWQPGNHTTASVSNLGAGIYSVTVTSANGCTATAQAEVGASQPVTATITVTPESCPDCDNGLASVMAMGATTYTYLWSNGATTPQIDSLAPGSYTVTVTGDNGCTATAVAVINAFGCEELGISATIVQPACHDSDGMISLQVEGGETPYTFSWNTGDTSAVVALSTGIYTVTVTDVNDCINTASFTLNAPPPILYNFVEISPITCAGDCNGILDIGNILGGTPPYSNLIWSNGGTGLGIGNLCAGDYTFSVTDSNGCMAAFEFGLLPGESVQVGIQGDTVLCFGESGVLSVGEEYESILWSTGSDETSIDINSGGVYQVSVTNAAGCLGIDNIEVIENTPLEITFIQSGMTVSVNVAGGQSPYTYEWSTGSTESTITVDQNGIYTVTITDSLGCSVVSETEVIITSTSDINFSNLNIYPNPAYSELYLSEAIPQAEIYLLDIIGKIHIVSHNGQRMDISHLPGGHYVIMIYHQNLPVFRDKVMIIH